MSFHLAVKKFIVRYTIENSKISLREIIRNLDRYLIFNFIESEPVIICSEGLDAKVIHKNKGIYLVKVYEEKGLQTRKKCFDEIRRKKNINERRIIDFIDKITKISPVGRVFKRNIFRKDDQAHYLQSRHNIASRIMLLENQSLEHYKKERFFIFHESIKNKYSDISIFLSHLKCFKVEIKGIKNTSLFMEVFALLERYKKHLGFVISLEEFILCIRQKSYSSYTIYKIHKTLYYIIKRKLVKFSLDERKSFFLEGIESFDNFESSEKFHGTNKYICSRKKMSPKSWKGTLKDFFLYIYKDLEISRMTVFSRFFIKNSQIDVQDRLNVLYFFLKCMAVLKKYNKIVDKIRHTNYSTFMGRNEISESAKKAFTNYEKFCDTNVIKFEPIKIGHIKFLFSKENFFFTDHNEAFRMEISHVKIFITSVNPDSKELKNLIKHMIQYKNIVGRRLTNSLVKL